MPLRGDCYSVRPMDSSRQEWEVYEVDSGKVIASDLSNVQAWREIDRLTNEAISRAESVSDWVATKEMKKP